MLNIANFFVKLEYFTNNILASFLLAMQLELKGIFFKSIAILIICGGHLFERFGLSKVGFVFMLCIVAWTPHTKHIRTPFSPIPYIPKKSTFTLPYPLSLAITFTHWSWQSKHLIQPSFPLSIESQNELLNILDPFITVRVQLLDVQLFSLINVGRLSLPLGIFRTFHILYIFVQVLGTRLGHNFWIRACRNHSFEYSIFCVYVSVVEEPTVFALLRFIFHRITFWFIFFASLDRTWLRRVLESQNIVVGGKLP